MAKTDTSRPADLSDAVERARQATARAMDEGREFASQAAARMGESMRDLREGAADAARQGADTLGDTAAAAQRELNRYRRVAGRYVSEQPVKTALIAAAVGAGVAALVLALSRGRRGE
jgi:ElaB/YqjD/DUF883 family membrane-anchored ribosome-binding protein